MGTTESTSKSVHSSDSASHVQECACILCKEVCTTLKCTQKRASRSTCLGTQVRVTEEHILRSARLRAQCVHVMWAPRPTVLAQGPYHIHPWCNISPGCTACVHRERQAPQSASCTPMVQRVCIVHFVRSAPLAESVVTAMCVLCVLPRFNLRLRRDWRKQLPFQIYKNASLNKEDTKRRRRIPEGEK